MEISLVLMQLLASFVNAEVKADQSYPYCAWYSQEAYDNNKWSGYWFANPIETSGATATIYVDTSSTRGAFFGFFHELGHVKDNYDGKVFSTTWEDEVSAWKTGVMIMRDAGFAIDSDDLLSELSETLQTYVENHSSPAQYAQAVETILSQSGLPAGDEFKQKLMEYQKNAA